MDIGNPNAGIKSSSQSNVLPDDFCPAPGINGDSKPNFERPYLESGNSNNLDPDELEEFEDIYAPKVPGLRKPSKGANRRDRQQIDNVAREYGLDRRDFGDYIEELKQAEGRGGADNYTYDELREIAEDFTGN